MPIVLIIAAAVVVLSVLASRHAAAKIQQTLGRANRYPAPQAQTGAEIARRFLDEEGQTDVEILTHQAVVTDYFDPKRRRLFLSRKVAQQPTLAAWAVALHEAAHATQTGDALSDLKWRQSCIRMSRYGPVFIGLLLAVMMVLKVMMPRIAIMAFGAVWAALFLLNIGTLAIEWNANLRLRRFLDKHIGEDSAERDELNSALAAMATREVGDLVRSPRYFFLSALPGTSKIRPRGAKEVADESSDD